ncbi:MAG: excinuclease ABC subunit UvrC [Gammaproteobacteria bacterium]|nr:excinuclease ABC subunit UvrC [Gammaproteobacteria bacterium]
MEAPTEKKEEPFDSVTFLASVSEKPGIYIFYDHEGKTLYVGKAKNLKNRLQSYFRTTGLTPKTRLMVSKIRSAETQQTRTESEALLLENNLIKDKRPRYNISLRDDKSFPYIRLTNKDTFPRFSFYRGRRSQPGKYYGPYPNAAAVREMLGHLHKIFRLRQCTDAFFRNRSRPCLQHQIKRCSAPCVDLISAEDYREDVRQAKAMLQGQDHSLLEELGSKMESAAETLDFESAAIFRDRIALLQRIREKQYVSSDASDADVVAVAIESGSVCFGVVSIRQGRNLGGRFDIQANPLDLNEGQLLEAFLPQNYFGNFIPGEILLSDEIESKASLAQIFSLENKSKVEIKQQCRAHRARWIESARINTTDYLRRHMNERTQINAQFVALSELLCLEEVPSRIECFDISHTMGERTVGSCVVFDQNGAVKSDYRRFNVEGIEPGDDYAAMSQVLMRRYKRVLENDGKLPDLVIIDGGKGQLGVAKTVFEELQILGSVILLGVSKGPERRAGEEQFHLIDRARAIIPKGTSAPSHLVQRIRDEAHRFAITGHRQRRAKARTDSALEQIEGVGDKRRRSLLRYFGGLQEIKRAGIEDLSKAPGISPALAEKIYNRFHR